MRKLVITDLEKRFDQQLILNDASFTFEQGKIYGLLGRNGAGKTTLFNCISQDDIFQGGTINLEVDGETKPLTPLDVSFVHTEPNLPLFLTGYEFIKYMLEINRARLSDDANTEPEFFLKKAGLNNDDAHKLLKDYSQGMKTKIQLVSALMIQSPVLLLDEPLTAVDVIAAHEMKDLILEYKNDAVVIFSTHILQLAQDISDEIVLLHDMEFSTIPVEDIHSSEFENEVIARLSDQVVADV